MITNHSPYHGIYYFMGLVLDVKSDGDQLIAGMPGVPDGYEVRLEPMGTDVFRTIGGPIDNTSATTARPDARPPLADSLLELGIWVSPLFRSGGPGSRRVSGRK